MFLCLGHNVFHSLSFIEKALKDVPGRRLVRVGENIDLECQENSESSLEYEGVQWQRQVGDVDLYLYRASCHVQ